MNRREGALSIHAGQPKPVPLRKIARFPFVPALIQPLDVASTGALDVDPAGAHRATMDDDIAITGVAVSGPSWWSVLPWFTLLLPYPPAPRDRPR
jgi:hypothetical protein